MSTAPDPAAVFATADLLDEHPDLAVCDPGWHAHGTITSFAGPIATVVAPEDNTLVRAAVESPGEGRVLVVDGLGSLRCALVGDNLARLAIDNGWAGIVVNGAIRDSAEIDTMPIGIRCLGTNPRKSVKADQGTEGDPVTFAGVRFEPGWWCYVDPDGIVVSPTPVHG